MLLTCHTIRDKAFYEKELHSITQFLSALFCTEWCENLKQIEELRLKLILKDMRMDVLERDIICIPLSCVVH